MNKHLKFYGSIVAVIIFAFIALFKSSPKQPQPTDFEHAKVVYVYDGDTVKLDNGERVRFLGIDTPESRENPKLLRDLARSGEDEQTVLAMGHAAYLFTKNLIDQKEIRLDFDIEKRDKYGRLLAYLYLPDGKFINAEIIKNGYAYPMTIPPNVKHADEFKEYFHRAVENKVGLWADHVPVKKQKKRKKKRVD